MPHPGEFFLAWPEEHALNGLTYFQVLLSVYVTVLSL